MGALCCGPERIDFDGEVDLFHFVLLRNVGKGAFGKVRIVQHKQSRNVYALKYINKARCAKMKAVPNIIQERRLLEEVDHPFVVNLRYAFQDDENCFFVLDLMLGGDLRFHLQRLKYLSEDTVRLYVAEISSALAFLHEKKIVHRDIKPDNILLDARGHAHVTDFNVAIHHPNDKLLTSVAGSKAYIAPEVLTKKGYSYAVDWWSLGVTAFELAFGRRPFRRRKSRDLTHAICRSHLKFPPDAETKFSGEGLLVLQKFLERDPQQRLGSMVPSELEDVKRQPWFNSINWNKLDSKEIVPSLVPDANKPNFDLAHELEELLLEERPLKVKKRKLHRDLSRLSPELRQMEEQFTVYNFQRTQRQTYYPFNQHIVSSIASVTTDLDLESSRPPTPATSVDAEQVVTEHDPPSVQQAPSNHNLIGDVDARPSTMS